MRLLWLCSLVPGVVRRARKEQTSAGGLWLDHVLEDLRRQGLTILVLCPGDGSRGQLDENCAYATFRRGAPYEVTKEEGAFFRRELEEFRPDVVHIWGTEYAQTLSLVDAAQELGLLERTVVSIQGLCGVYAGHYCEGLPHSVQRACTFRDLVRRDNVLGQQHKFALRGELEAQALGKVRHIIGRTTWDRACAAQLAPQAQYHFCNETLRQPFYDGGWSYERCDTHRIFASSCEYPIKGFHYLLEALGQVARDFPDARLAVPGKNFLTAPRHRRTAYQRYLAQLARRHGVADRLEFLGRLSAEEMKGQYLKANVFVLPSTVENSPNSLGEAMLLGLPCVAADVGGVTDLLSPGEGFVYPSTAAYMLAYHIRRVFDLGPQAEQMGRAARAHALVTHDPAENLKALLAIYDALAEGEAHG